MYLFIVTIILFFEMVSLYSLAMLEFTVDQDGLELPKIHWHVPPELGLKV